MMEIEEKECCWINIDNTIYGFHNNDEVKIYLHAKNMMIDKKESSEVVKYLHDNSIQSKRHGK